MKSNFSSSKVIHATKWSAITEIVAKLLAPMINMILARLLTPEAFGVVATVTMIISLAEMFTDAGFQKYLVQHEFQDDEEKYKSASVAFWTNLTIAIVLWIVITIFAEPLASLVGNPGLGHVIIISCMVLPLTSFSSIQMSLFRREFEYKTLFFVKLIGISIPIVVTIPLAILGLSYWSLIIGTICTQLSNAVILTVKSSWKPNMYYSFSLLKKMFSFSFWSLVESISIWLTSWSGTFIVSSFLNSYYLGLYKTSITTVNGIMSLITAATTPVLFGALSRLQNDTELYVKTYFTFQRIVGMLVLPLGVGIYLYRDLVTEILLGSQWVEASDFLGLWGLMSGLSIVLSHYSSEVYRSKGKPKLSFIAQMLHLVVLIPVVYISVGYGFEALTYARSLVRLQFIVVHMIIMYFVIGISPIKIMKNISVPFICSIWMGVVAYYLRSLSTNIIWELTSILICIVFYFSIIVLVPSYRKELLGLFKKVARVK